jgi:hypothetical protein
VSRPGPPACHRHGNLARPEWSGSHAQSGTLIARRLSRFLRRLPSHSGGRRSLHAPPYGSLECAVPAIPPGKEPLLGRGRRPANHLYGLPRSPQATGARFRCLRFQVFEVSCPLDKSTVCEPCSGLQRRHEGLPILPYAQIRNPLGARNLHRPLDPHCASWFGVPGLGARNNLQAPDSLPC